MTYPAQTRITQNGAGWYWELVTYDCEVIGRGIADSHAHARADAAKVSPDESPR